jgi:hypothetical protein
MPPTWRSGLAAGPAAASRTCPRLCPRDTLAADTSASWREPVSCGSPRERLVRHRPPPRVLHGPANGTRQSSWSSSSLRANPRGAGVEQGGGRVASAQAPGGCAALGSAPTGRWRSRSRPTPTRWSSPTLPERAPPDRLWTTRRTAWPASRWRAGLPFPGPGNGRGRVLGGAAFTLLASAGSGRPDSAPKPASAPRWSGAGCHNVTASGVS